MPFVVLLAVLWLAALLQTDPRLAARQFAALRAAVPQFAALRAAVPLRHLPLHILLLIKRIALD